VRALLLVLLAQPNTMNLNLNLQPIMSRQGGAALSTKRQYAIDCRSNMTCVVDGGVLLLSAASGGAGSSDFDGGYNRIQDEGVDLTKRLTVDFTGAGVTCTDTGAKTSCSIPGGSGSVNVVEVEVDFGATGNDTASTVVTGQAWVTGTSKIVCSPTMLSTADRAEGAEDVLLEGIEVAIHTRVAATGFTLTAHAPVRLAFGKFLFHCTGA